MYLVTKDFIDKDNNKRYLTDSIYRSNSEERIEELRNLGFIGVELAVKEADEEVNQGEETGKEVEAVVPDEKIEKETVAEPEKKASKKK